MRINEIKSDHFNLADVAKIASTAGFRKKVQESCRIIETFLELCKHPAVSFGGGKDGTAALILAQTVDPNITVICANPPNPLPGRREHLNNFMHSCCTNIIMRDYTWDVTKVLEGAEKYPEGLKMRTLKNLQAEMKIDGIIWGCRNSESKARTYNFARNGYIYQVADSTYRCQPIAKWTAEESLALAAVSGYPINPVYEKMDGFYNLDCIHDGTWWPHEMKGEKGSWIKQFYPECYKQYMDAVKVYRVLEYKACCW